MARFYRQLLLDRLRAQSLRLLNSADTGPQSQASLVLPINFLDELSQCLEADLHQLEPCLCLLSRVTFASRTAEKHQPQDFRVYLLWRRVHMNVLNSQHTGSPQLAAQSNQFVESNLLKAASRLTGSPGSPALLARAIHADILPILLRRYIDVGATPPQEFLHRLASCTKPVADYDLVTMAEQLLERTHDETWVYLIPIYPQLLTFLLVLNYGEVRFLSRLWLACDRWPALNDLVRGCASAISDNAVKMTIFGKDL